jgi:hypothetical protein
VSDGVRRCWRGAGCALGALIAGLVADAASPPVAIALVAALTAANGLIVLVTPFTARLAATPVTAA